MNATSEVAIAGLLHDVGKILQRAQVHLTKEANRMPEMLCPTGRDGRPTHLHALWTSDFLESVCQRLPEGLDAARIKRLANQHHRPGADEDWLIAEADRLASGHDRRPDEEGSDATTYRQVALKSVLAAATLGDALRNTSRGWLPRPSAVDDLLLPQDVTPAAVENAWGGLARDMLAAAGRMNLRDLSPNRVIQSLMGFSERYQSFVPASGVDRPDVSLHDHALLTAALACVLYRFHQTQGSLTEKAIRDRGEPKFRFVVGSLSGIQEFIFALPEKAGAGIARPYRAKSFYLSVLTEAVVQHLLDAVQLPPVCAVMNAGGRFVILVDASEHTLRRLRDAARRIADWLADQHAVAMGMNLGYDVVVSASEFLDGRFAGVYRRLELSAEAAKRQPLAELLCPDGRWAADRFRRNTNAQDAAARFHEIARLLGAALPRADWVGLFPAGAAPQGLLEKPIDCLGYQLQLGNPDRPFDARAAIWAVSVHAGDENHCHLPFRPMANYVPLLTQDDVEHIKTAMRSAEDIDETDEPHVGNTATFSQLAALACTPTGDGVVGRPMFACLKADVDRLGLLFSRGLGKDVSFGRVATMSRLLDLFFKGHLMDRFTRDCSPYRHVYTVFSGGDDLMLIGPWPVMFHLAEDLHKWLDEFTGANPHVTLTAALVLGHPKTPLAEVARTAEDQLKKAKQQRNRIAVAGQVLAWDEFAAGLACGKRLLEMLQAYASARRSGKSGSDGRLALPRAFVHRLLAHARSAQRVQEAIQARKDIPLADLTWRSHYLYDLRRNVESRILHDAPEAQREDLNWLKTLLPAHVGRHSVSHVILGATYALYMTRGGRHE